MLLKKFVKQFSRTNNLIIPYSPIGYIYPPFDEDAQSEMINYYKFDEKGFIYAFKNLISSINDKDFYEFAKDNCDLLLVEGFRKGMKKLKADGKNVEVVTNHNIEEAIFFTESTVLVEIDQNKSFFSQKFIYNYDLQGKCEFYEPTHKGLISHTLTFGSYIKCSTSLQIKGFNTQPNSFHYVQFQLIKDRNTQQGSQLLQLFQKQNSKILGGKYEWRIINIDNFLKKPE